MNRSKGHFRFLRFLAPGVALAMSLTIPARLAHGSASFSPRPGSWTQLGGDQGGATATLLHVANGNDLVVWMAPVVGNRHLYDALELKPNGGKASSPMDIFGGNDWGGLDSYSPPTLLSQNGEPLLVFEGGRSTLSTDPYRTGCIFGDLRTASGWQLQTWSLSAGCASTAHFGAAINSSGTISSAWPGGWANGNGIRYRIGVSPTNPATPDDKEISTAPGGAGAGAEATETRSQDMYAAWDRFFSKPASKDGTWAADLSNNPVPLKAPGTGTNTAAHEPEPVAIASPTGRGGIYLAYPNNSSPFSKLLLWRYGAKKAVTVPKSSLPTSVSISAGPSGRLWIAWWSSQNGTVRVVRTNESGSAFGPVATHAGPHGCKSDGNGTIKISSGSQQRLDIVVACYDYIAAHGATHVSATQSLVPLQIGASKGAIARRSGGSVTYRVSDVGDAVQGAAVTVDGKQGTTDARGQVTFRFPKGSRTGTFGVVASMANYLNASTSLRIT